jgi:hypothetical protein
MSMTPLERMVDAYTQEANQWGVFTQDGKGVIARWHRTDDFGGMETVVIETHDNPPRASARFGLLRKNAAMRAALLALAEAELPDTFVHDAWQVQTKDIPESEIMRAAEWAMIDQFRAMLRAIAKDRP